MDLADVADRLAVLDPERPLLVAVDGIDGSGKTTIAGRLAAAVSERGRDTQIVHVDDFMHPPEVRHRRGRTSAEGYFHDSYDYDALAQRLRQTPQTPVVTIVEGLFLHRDELVLYWDRSLFVDVNTGIALGRKSRRDRLVLEPTAPLTRRYIDGQRLYLEACRPHERATWVIGNGGPLA